MFSSSCPTKFIPILSYVICSNEPIKIFHPTLKNICWFVVRVMVNKEVVNLKDWGNVNDFDKTKKDFQNIAVEVKQNRASDSINALFFLCD